VQNENFAKSLVYFFGWTQYAVTYENAKIFKKIGGTSLYQNLKQYYLVIIHCYEVVHRARVVQGLAKIFF